MRWMIGLPLAAGLFATLAPLHAAQPLGTASHSQTATIQRIQSTPDTSKPDINQPDKPFSGRNCTCRAMGHDFEIGRLMCLATPEGQKLARCDMAINVPSWTIMREGCETQ